MFCGQCHAQAAADRTFCDKCGADRPAEGWGPDRLPGTVIAGKYRLEQRLGSGGMGYVYRARHVELGTDFAIKFLHRDLTTSVHKKRFVREARVCAALKNPHVVKVVDFGSGEDQLYLVMEHVPGPNLATHVQQHGAPSPAFVVALLRQVGMALDEAHAQGTVHRDIKPENILIAPARHGYLFKLTDFGIASLMGDESERLTRTGMVHGSPGYMSPEQAEGKRDLDGRADLYALGVIAWELLADRPMFEASNPMELILLHMREEPESLRALRPPPDVPSELHDLVDGLLCKDREDRIASAAELVDAAAAVVASSSDVRPEKPTPQPAQQPAAPTAQPLQQEQPPAATAPLDADELVQTRLVRRSSPAVPRVEPASLPTAQDLPATGKEGATGRIETLAATPHGYNPVGNPVGNPGSDIKAKQPVPGAALTPLAARSPSAPRVPASSSVDLPDSGPRPTKRGAPGLHDTGGATARIQTLSASPHGYNPVGNPEVQGKDPVRVSSGWQVRTKRRAVDEQSRVELDDNPLQALRESSPSAGDAPDDVPESQPEVGAAEAPTALGESLGDFDDVYEQTLPTRGKGALWLLLGVAIAAAAWWLLSG